MFFGLDQDRRKRQECGGRVRSSGVERVLVISLYFGGVDFTVESHQKDQGG